MSCDSDCSQIHEESELLRYVGECAVHLSVPLQRLARDRNDPSHWFDYGCFYMLRGDYQKAEECFHQAVSINQAHLSR